MIIYPTVKPEQLRGMETDFGSSISASIWRKIVNNQTWVERAVPIGMVMFLQEEITLANGNPKDPPNPEIWTLLDGKTINDFDSPLNGVTLPDFRNLFPKGSETEFALGGNAKINIQHNHGGATGVTNDIAEQNADIGTDHVVGAPHVHSMDNRWSTVEPIIPKFFELQAYVRYK